MAEPAAPIPGARLVAGPDAVRAAYAKLAAGVQPLVDAGDCVLVGLLMGGMMPLVHVAERLRGDFLIDYCHVTRYRDSTRGGELAWIQQPRQALRDRTVVLVDDIFDQGRTLAELTEYCRVAGARRVLLAVLARKRHGRAVVELQPELVGMEIEDRYVFGCGMDYRQRWRHLDALWALPPEAT